LSATVGQSEKECRKLPKLIFQPKLAPEDQERIESSSLTGRVSVIVNERGDVMRARVLEATPKVGAQILFDAVMMLNLPYDPDVLFSRSISSLAFKNSR
jgi:hypothetical protein